MKFKEGKRYKYTGETNHRFRKGFDYAVIKSGRALFILAEKNFGILIDEAFKREYKPYFEKLGEGNVIPPDFNLADFYDLLYKKAKESGQSMEEVINRILGQK